MSPGGLFRPPRRRFDRIPDTPGRELLLERELHDTRRLRSLERGSCGVLYLDSAGLWVDVDSLV